ncbi:Cysteine protease atg4d [Clonorchis sinensis]|uniref:Cysteine protease n=1 Tax=Clonorchis sinensis TaxID=79923 RepID=A0A8T1MCM2_CLOSI|nr:Cysteine protease atg4d [Clonorchis sinensis]
MSHSVETHKRTIFNADGKRSHHDTRYSETGFRTHFSTSDHMRAALNQIKFGWNLHIWPSFDRDAHIYFMGRRYSTNEDACPVSTSAGSFDGTLADFADDFATRLWFTYREDFPPLGSGDQRSLDFQRTSVSIGADALDQSGSSRSSAADDVFIDSDLGLLVNVPSAFHEDGLLVPGKVSSQRKGKGIRRLVPKVSMAFRKYKPAGVVQHDNMPATVIPLSIQTSDSGWGCMIRSGQMLLAQALMIHLLGRDWRAFRGTSPIKTPEDHLHRQLIRWFHDCWSQESPFSLHRLVQASGQLPGSWFGPATLCSALVKVMSDASRRFEELARVHIYWVRDRVIYREEIMNLARGQPVRRKPGRLNFTDFSENFQHCCSQECSPPIPPTYLQDGIQSSPSTTLFPSHAVILLLPIRLGLDKRIDARYVPMVCRLVRDPCFVGIIGGRPRHSIYILGCQNTQLIHLDPHFTQPVVRNVVDSEEFNVKTWHCLVPRVIEAAKLDPSCAVGFYCRSRGDLSDLLERLPQTMSIRTAKSTTSPVMESLIEIKDEDE